MKKLKFLTLFILSMLFVLSVGLVFADGTETLGTPSISIASGTGIAAAGTGLQSQPGTINLNVPGTINQVLVYWSGAMIGQNSGDDTLNLNGTSVTGTLIGGPAYFFTCPAACGPNAGDFYYSSYRADITGMGLVQVGANNISVDGLNFSGENSGASIVVIYDDGGTTANIQVRDGLDLAFINFPAPRDTTVPQTFTFAASANERTADLTILAGSVGEDDRPNIIRVTVAGNTTDFVNVLGSNDGGLWDTAVIAVTIPAGATDLTVQALSASDGSGHLPASFNWVGTGLSVPNDPPPPPGGGQGCTPGYWKQPHHLDSWVNYSPTDDYETVFGVDASFDKDLLGALKQGGGGEKALGRHAVAALLNAASGGVDYLYTEADVIAMVQQAYATGDFEGIKNLFEVQNESGCPLN